MTLFPKWKIIASAGGKVSKEDLPQSMGGILPDTDGDFYPDAVDAYPLDPSRHSRIEENIKGKLKERTDDIRTKLSKTQNNTKIISNMNRNFNKKFNGNRNKISTFLARTKYGDKDFDKDGVINLLDCKPFDKSKQDFRAFTTRLIGADPRLEPLRQELGRETAAAEQRKIVKTQIRKDVRAALQPKAQIFRRKPQTVQAKEALFSNYSQKMMSFAPELNLSTIEKKKLQSDLAFKTGVYKSPTIKESRQSHLTKVTGVQKESGPFSGLNKERNRLKAKGLL